MKTVKFKIFSGDSAFKPVLVADGKNIDTKMTKYGSYEAEISTEQNEMEIYFSNVLELSGKLWWLYAILSFILSVFGIFEPIYKKRYKRIDCRFLVMLNDINDISLKVGVEKTDAEAVQIQSSCAVEVFQNEAYEEKRVKTRRIIYLLFKIVVWILLIAFLSYQIVKLFKGVQ